MSLSKKRKPLVAGFGKEGRVFAKELKEVRSKFIEMQDERKNTSSPVSAFTSEEDFAVM